MTLTDHSLILFLAIAAGILGQMLLSALKRPGLAYRAGQVVLMVFWVGVEKARHYMGRNDHHFSRRRAHVRWLSGQD